MTDIAGKAAVITGGGTGIGSALAKELARQGVPVAVADIMIDNARRTVEEITAAGGKAIAVSCDVCERASVRAMKEEVNAALGPIQLLFANAGATSFEPLVEMEDNDIDWLIQVNLMGVMNAAQVFLPDMLESGDAHIVATASMAGLLAGLIPVHVVYSAAKLGVIGMMLNLALETREHGVHCTTYCPGGVETGIGSRTPSYRPARYGGPREGRIAIPKASFRNNPVALYAPESVAPIVLEAVRDNRPFVFDHSDQREDVRRTFTDLIEAGFDTIEAWENEHGRPEVVRRQT